MIFGRADLIAGRGSVSYMSAGSNYGLVKVRVGRVGDHRAKATSAKPQVRARRGPITVDVENNYSSFGRSLSTLLAEQGEFVDSRLFEEAHLANRMSRAKFLRLCVEGVGNSLVLPHPAWSKAPASKSSIFDALPQQIAHDIKQRRYNGDLTPYVRDAIHNV